MREPTRYARKAAWLDRSLEELLVLDMGDEPARVEVVPDIEGGCDAARSELGERDESRLLVERDEDRVGELDRREGDRDVLAEVLRGRLRAGAKVAEDMVRDG